MEKRLTYKQEVFCQEYAIDYNATRAYKAAYVNIKNNATAQANGSRLLLNAIVKAKIDEIQKDTAKAAGISRLMIVNELKDLAFRKVPSPEEEATEAHVKVSDKLKALVEVSKILGMNGVEKVEHSGEIVNLVSLGTGINPEDETI